MTVSYYQSALDEFPIVSQGVSSPGGFTSWAAVFVVQRDPTDPIGLFALTLQNVVVGSAILVEVQSTGEVMYAGTAEAASVLLNLNAYAVGNPRNDLKVKVRKGTASPFYRPYETLVNAVVGAQSVYISQIPDE